MTTVGRTDNAYAAGRPYPWQEGRVDLRGTQAVVDANGSVNLERIAALDPDLILATNFRPDRPMYDRLSAIAPTVAATGSIGAASWQELATQVGAAVGRPDEMAARVTGVEDFLAGLAREYPGLRGKTYAGAFHYATGQFRVNTNPDAQSARVLGSLGITLNPELAVAAVDRQLSQERLDVLDVDLLVISFASPDLKTTLEADPLYSGLAVVRDGREFVGDNNSAQAGNNPTLLTIPWLLEQQRDVLSRVAGR